MTYFPPRDDEKGEQTYTVRRRVGLPLEFRGTFLGSVLSRNGRWSYQLYRLHDGRWLLATFFYKIDYRRWTPYATSVHDDEASLFEEFVPPGTWAAFGFRERI